MQNDKPNWSSISKHSINDSLYTIHLYSIEISNAFTFSFDSNSISSCSSNCVCNLVICNFIDFFVKLFHKFNNRKKPYWLFAMSFAGDKLFGLFHTCFMWRIPSKAPRREWEETIVVYSFAVFMSVCSECCCCCCFMLDGYSQIDASDTSQIHRNCHSKMWWQCCMKRGGGVRDGGRAGVVGIVAAGVV